MDAGGVVTGDTAPTSDPSDFIVIPLLVLTITLKNTWERPKN